MRIKPRDVLGLLVETYEEWSRDKASRLGAALAYYTIFSIAPLLIVVIAVVSMIWGNQDNRVQYEIFRQISNLTGPEGAAVIRTMLENNSRNESTGVIATIAGLAALIFGATGVFAQLQDALNTIWEVRPRVSGLGIKSFIMTRLLSFGMVLTIGFLLLVSLVVSAIISAIGASFSQLFNLVISFAVITALFAIIYKVLPDVKVSWRDVWIGSVITSFLFGLGKFALGLYLGNSTVASSYGAAGSLVVLLLWIYYSAQIFFFGAEFTEVFARKYGSEIEPADHAVRVVVTETEVPGPVTGDAAVEVREAKPEVPERRPVLKRWTPVLLAFIAGRIMGRRD